MTRTRSTYSAPECQRLVVYEARKWVFPEAGEGGPPVARLMQLPALSGRAGEGFVIAVATVGERAPADPRVVVAFRPRLSKGDLSLEEQRLSLFLAEDSRGRRRWRWYCPDAYCRQAVDVLYLAPGSRRFLCRGCARVADRRKPLRTGGEGPAKPDVVEAAAQWSRRWDQETVAAAPGMTLQRNRVVERRDAPVEPVSLRARAVAELWAEQAWSLKQLGDLFGVSERTIKRDLREARRAGRAPDRSRRAQQLRQRARAERLVEVLREHRDQSGTSIARPSSLSDPRLAWVLAALAHWAGEEWAVLAPLISEGGHASVSDGRRGEAREAPEYLDPELLARAWGAARSWQGER